MKSFTQLLILLGFVAGCSLDARVSQSSRPQQATTIVSSTPNERGASRSEDLEQIPIEKATIENLKGNDWLVLRKQFGSSDLIDAYFADESHGWLVSLRGNKLLPEGAKILRTVDGGKSWSSSFEVGRYSYISNLFFLDKSRGWSVVQTLGNEDKGHDSELGLIETENGGSTWKKTFVLKNAFASKVIFKQTGEAWLVGFKGKNTYSFNRSPLALYSGDFGKTWRDASPELPREIGDESSQTDPEIIADVNLPNDQTAMLITGSGKVLRSEDIGKRWHQTAKLRDEDFSLGFKILDGDEIRQIALSNASVPEGTWSLVTAFTGSETVGRYLFENTYLTDFSMLQDKRAIACGLARPDLNGAENQASNVILISTDLKKWEAVYRSSSGCGEDCGFNKLTQINDKTFFAVGNHGVTVLISKK